MNEQSELLKCNHLIYMDTCTILNSDKFISFMENNRELFVDYNKKIVLIGAVIYELKTHLNSEYWHIRTAAKKSLDYIYSNKCLFDIHERKEYETFADPEFQIELLKNRRYKKQMFITEDHKLARDINKFNTIESCVGKEISIYEIDVQGCLQSPNYLDDLEFETVREPSKLDAEVKSNTKKWYEFKGMSKAKEIGVATVSFVAGASSVILAPFLIRKLKSITTNI